MKPPSRIISWLLSRMIDRRVRYDALGDYEEMYFLLVNKRGNFTARIWYLSQVFIMLPKFLLSTFIGKIYMSKNYFKTIVRNLKRQKLYSGLNIFGLAFGLACFILIFKFIYFELSYETCHKNAERIYKVVTQVAGEQYMGSNRYAITPAPLAPAMMEEFPEVAAATRLYKSSNVVIKYKENVFLENNWLYADNLVFKVFTIPLLTGDPETALNAPFSVIISRKMARKYFDNENPIGKQLIFNSSHEFTVTGVMENMPVNTHIRCDFIADFASLNVLLFNTDHWGRRAFHTYFLLRKGSDADGLLDKYPLLLESKLKDSKWWNKEESDRYYHQRLLDIHLKSDTIANLGPVSDIKYIYIFSIIAAFILLIACINYMNLATARSAGRAKEIGVRKVIGAQRLQIISQFIGESVFFSILSLAAGYLLAWLLLPVFNDLIDAELSLNLINNSQFTIFLLLVGLSVGIIAGSYPAFFLSSFTPVKALKSCYLKNHKGVLLRNILVVGQFSISIFLIIGTLIISRQIDYIRNKKLGYSRESIITTRILDKTLLDNVDAFKSALLNQTGISNVTLSSTLPIRFNNSIYMQYEGMPDSDKNGLYTYFATVDYDYFKTFGMKIVMGRDFSKELDGDSPAYIINETAAKTLGWENPIGKMYGYTGSMGPVVGVVNDFHYADFHISLESVSFQLLPKDGRVLSIKFNGRDVQYIIADIENVWKSFSSGYPFVYEFVDEKYDAMYKSEIRMGKIFQYFSILAVVICCLGLFGLASYRIEQAAKEIGVRKILGASHVTIFNMLVWKFIQWILIANIIAWPVAYYYLHAWLAEFAYRTTMPVSVFILAGGIGIAIALSTIIFQLAKVSLSNPVNVLKSE